MAKTGLLQDSRFEAHDTGHGHPERPQRLSALRKAFDESGLTEACAAVEVSPVDMGLVRGIHDDQYLERLQRACDDGLPYVDVPDSAICPESFDIARLAAGGVVSAVSEVMAERLDNAFCAVRPPGHHAERDRSMGFCLLNNIALAAAHLIEHHGLSRVLILDWDVHHGNGTQHIFDPDPQVLFISLHGHPDVLYPGTGHAKERGVGEGEGFTLNVPIMPGAGDEAYRRAFDESIEPQVDRFKPQFVLISAGFDAHRLDPLAPIQLETESFGWMTERALEMAKRHGQGRLVSVLEGGYHLESLAASAVLHVSKLLEA